ncbi:MAG TPA: hypothetical protein VI999_07775 [Thermoplasmata archaeon]|nr:hypothetical protein [Thermoplasmata archaeon]
MALLLDPAAAALYGLAVFLVFLGVLVVFVEAIQMARFLLLLSADVAFAVLLVLVGELGVALVVLGLGGALIANQVFEWLTTR